MRSSGAVENNYLYRGEQVDPNIGMQYLRARYYDQNTGRFASTDPFEGWQEQPMSRHRYVYGNDNPLTYSDPSGLFGLAELTATAKTLAELGGAMFAVQYTAVQVIRTLAKEEIEWTGKQFSASVSAGTRFPAGTSLGGIYTIADSSWYPKASGGYERYVGGEWFTMLGGAGVALRPEILGGLGGSFFIGDATLQSPMILGAGPETLSGGTVSIGAAIGLAIGGSYTLFLQMGYASGNFSWLPTIGTGIGASLDALVGISIPTKIGRYEYTSTPLPS